MLGNGQWGGGRFGPFPAGRGLTHARVAVSATFAMVGGGGQKAM